MAGGIILTDQVGFNGGTPSTVIEETIMPNTIEAIDIVNATSCPSFKWFISISDEVTNETRSLECNAIHDFSSNVRFAFGAILGVKLDVDIQVTAGPSPNELMLVVENLSTTNSIKVCVYRMLLL